MRNDIRHEKGFALVVVLMVLVVLSVLTMSILGLAANNATMTRGERDDQSAYYIAEGGFNQMRAEIEAIAQKEAKKERTIPENSLKTIHDLFIEDVKSEVNIVKNNSILKNPKFSEVFGGTPEAKVEVKLISDNPFQYKIESIGFSNNKIRALKGNITINFKIDDSSNTGNFPDTGTSAPIINGIPDGTAVFVNGNIDMSGSAAVEGNVVTNKKGSATIRLSGNPTIKGSIFVPRGSESQAVSIINNVPNIPYPFGMESPGTMELPSFPNYPNYSFPSNVTLTKDGNKKDVIKDGALLIDNYISNNYILNLENDIALTTIKITSNNKLTINVGDSDKTIVLDKMDLQYGHIELIGTGKLTLLVKNSFHVGGGSINKDGDNKRLEVFLQKSTNQKELTFASDLKIHGSIYAEDANIKLSGGGGFQGNIFTGGKSIIIDGGSRTDSSLILAPNADVTLTGGGKVTGSIYANSFTASGGSSITYGKPLTPVTPPTIPGDDNDKSQDNTSHTILNELIEI